MRRAIRVFCAIALSLLAITSHAKLQSFSPKNIIPQRRGPLQDIVTWDEHSLKVHGERIIFYSGEVHPFRLPVPDLWLDVFQKIKALGFNGVSFYVDWALLEGKPGEYRAEGVFALEPFFEAAQKAGIYLLARPGPYINAEVSGGGFPGWIQRINGTLRTRAPDFLKATDNYMANVGKTIGAGQITNGGPIILVQPENEYTSANSRVPEFPDPEYMQYIYDQLRNAGIVVPLINNDAGPDGHNAPGQPAPVDIYGHDGYPLGFSCANPTQWPEDKLPTKWRELHLKQSPNTPYAIIEYQGGSYDPWGGFGLEKCYDLVNPEFQRVFYKDLYSLGLTIFNVYMEFGGTNWGNLGHPGGYTSYDYGAAIRENRRVDREKYSEQKLQANFFKVSPAYLTASRGNPSDSMWTTTTDITVTPAVKDSTRFYFLRHTKYTTLDSTTYKLKIPTSAFGNITVPQLNNTSLTLNGRDSKIHVSDYDIGGSTLVYSTAEIFTWHKYEDKTVLVLYGGLGETHELVLAVTGLETLEGEFRSIATRGYTLINWKATEQRKVAKVGVNSFIYVYLLDRNSAYNYWSIDQAPHDSSNSVILRAGYLMRTAAVSGTELSLTGDLNTTQPIEILGGAPRNLTKLIFNNQTVPFTSTKQGTILTDEIIYPRPKPYIPKLSELPWKYISGLPELDSSYSDDQWTPANLTETHNSQWKPPTPTSLYASDYGYHAGTLLYRAHFTAVGNEKNLMIDTMGGRGFGASIWLNSTFVGSWRGGGDIWSQRKDFALPSSLEAGKPYVFTVVLDTMGLDQTWTIGDESGKNPRGILDYCLSENGTPCTEITWKLTGNLGGESYYDKSRGPLNEGGLYPERQGLHLPGAFASTEIDWKNSTGPTSHAITDAGIHFYATEFDLGLPSGYDIPLSFVFSNSTTPPAYRATIYVNGWQFGKYVSNIGPQTKFPVPEGILDYHGKNYLVVMVWALDKEETKLEGLELVVDGVVWSGRGDVSVVEGKKYEEREGAY